MAKKSHTRNPRPQTRGAPGRGRTPAELVRASNRWRDTYNPLRGLVISKVVALLEQAERGDFAELQLTCRKIEKRYPVVRGLIARRLSALEKLDWDVKVMDPLPDGVSEAQAEEHRKFLRARYDLIENLTDAFGDLERAEFRGYAILQKHFYQDGPNDGAVRELHWLPQETWVRDGQYGDWYYNRDSQFGIGLDSARSAFGEENRIGSEQLPREAFVIRECEMALYEIYLIAFVNWAMGRKDWAAFTEIFGIPASIVIMPPNIPSDKEDEYLSAANSVAEGSSGALPNGSDAKFPSASVRGEAPFKSFSDAQDADVVLAGTGGRLAMLTADKGGLGDGPAEEHADAFDDIAQASARKISQTLQRDFDRVELSAQFPGQPICVYFELAAPDQEDVDKLVERVVKLESTGLETDAQEVSEKVGLKLTRRVAIDRHLFIEEHSGDPAEDDVNTRPKVRNRESKRVLNYDTNQPRDDRGRWIDEGIESVEVASGSMEFFHGRYRDDDTVHSGMTFADNEETATRYAKKKMLGGTVDVTGLRIARVRKFDRDDANYGAIGDHDSDLTHLAGKGIDVIAYDDEDPHQRQHRAWRIVSPKAVERFKGSIHVRNRKWIASGMVVVVRNRESQSAFAATVSADLQPVLQALAERLQAVFSIHDPALRLQKFRDVWAELEPLRNDVVKDPASAHALAQMNAAALAKGLTQ